MEVHGVKANARRWGMLMLSIGCLIVFSAPIAGQSTGDPAKAQMEEMNRRELQLNSLGGDKGHFNES